MTRVTLREETPQDIPAIREINRLAFAGEGEAVLVDGLRTDQDVVVSLVALQNDVVVGHVLFSRLRAPDASLQVASLAPVAVLPEHQRQGIGKALIEEGLERCRTRGYQAVIVLGDPAYYPRFGFSAERAKGLASPYSQFGEAYMALALVPGALDGVDTNVEYPKAFARLG
jgi:putative acetyltransferase